MGGERQREAALEKFGKLSANLDQRLAPLVASAEETLATATEALAQIRETVSAADPDSPLRYQFSETLDEVKRAARAIRILADYLERNPNAMLFGKKARDD